MRSAQLSRDQRRTLIEEGYVVLRNLVPEVYVQSARRLINRKLGEGTNLAADKSRVGAVYARNLDSVEIPAISDPFNQTDLLPLVESLIGSVDLVRSENVQVALRYPEATREEYPMHVDGDYVPPEMRNFTALAIVFLSDCLDADMGNFTVVPRSHRVFGRLFAGKRAQLNERLNEIAPNNEIKSLLALFPAEPLQAPRQVKVAAGDVVLLHGLLAHGVSPNLSPDIRYALVARFIPHGLAIDAFDANHNRLVDMWSEWPGLADDLEHGDSERRESAAVADTGTKIFHVISPHEGSADVNRRTSMFYSSVANANKCNVSLVAASVDGDTPEGWQTGKLGRDARMIGDTTNKPFIKDLFDLALEYAAPDDWLLVSNCDCPLAPDFYQDLIGKRGTVVEYMRRNVPSTDCASLEMLLGSGGSVQDNGIDGLAIRAGYYRQIRDSLPNPVIGAPHWDTVYSGILRRLGPVRVSMDKLFHPEHEPTWALASPASRYNQEIYEEGIKYGDLARNVIATEPEFTDTAVVVVSFGADTERALAHVAAIERILRQDLYCDIFLVELLQDGEPSAYPDTITEKVHYIVRRGTDANRDLFQKEALMNIGWRTAIEKFNYDYFVFVDADVYADDHSWFRQIRDRLAEDPRRVVQGFQLVEDSGDPRIKYSALLARKILGFHTDIGNNPGLCWAMHRWVLEESGGFNPYYIDGFGDSGFVAEYIDPPGSVYDHGLSRHRWTWQVRRNLELEIIPDCVPVNVVHVHHGSFNERNYENVHRVVGGFERPVLELVTLDEKGLLAWNDPGCRERLLLRERSKLVSPDSVTKIFKEHNYRQQFARPVSLDRRRSSWSRSHSSGYQSILERWEHQQRSSDGPERGLYIFNPSRVFKKHFAFSWCCNVKNSNADNRIPMNGAATPPELVLDAQDDAEWFMATLPLAQSWVPVDISKFQYLRLCVAISRTAAARMSVRLVSMSENGTENSSTEITLPSLETDIVHMNTIKLAEFECEDFDYSRVRRLDVMGHGSYCAKLSRIVFE